MVACESVIDQFGFAEMQVVAFEDLFGGKLHATLDRQHPRDLFDIKKDPQQLYNVTVTHRDLADRLRFEYEEWYKDVSERFGETCPLVIGAQQQNPVQLTCFDWHGGGADQTWHQRQIATRPVATGYWIIEPQRPGRYRFTLRERPAVARFPLSSSLTGVR